ncbi:hypothetical protein SUGI_0344970 [Cryptomeria japonica]|nr:hypothetical protein SUGI_0344970 [Cryptomeria japonica]
MYPRDVKGVVCVWCIFKRTSGRLQLLLLTALSLVFKRQIASAVFGDNPPIRQDVLANAFNINDEQIKELISEQGSPTAPASVRQGSLSALAPVGYESAIAALHWQTILYPIRASSYFGPN